MARKRKENPNQLKLFMTPREIMGSHSPLLGDYIGGESTEELWERKADEAESNGLMDSIREQGVQVPVSLSPGMNMIVGGHHRIAAQHRLNPDQFIPVNYEEGPGSANAYDSQTEDDHGLKLGYFDDSYYEYD
jgi:hypothetical protein